MSGFIILARAAFENPLLKDGERFRAFFWMVQKACWKPTPFDIGGRIVTLQRGQFCTSRAQLAGEWGWSPSAVERFLTRLKTEQMIEQETGQGRSIITICNYDKYQSASDEAGQATGQATGQRSDSHRTAKEQGNKETREEEPDGPSSQPARDECEQVVAAFNAVAAPLKLSTCQKLSPKRLQACKARIRDHGLEAILTAIQRIPDSAFLRGDRGDWAGANIDFLLRPDTVTKILEGRYDDRTGNRPAQPADDRRDALSRTIDRWANLDDAQEPAVEPERSGIQPGEGHSQGALALPRPAHG